MLAQVRSAVDAVLAVPTWQLPSSEVAALVERLAEQAARLSAAQLRLLAEAAEQRVGSGGGYLTTAAWYSSTTRSRLREAGPTVATIFVRTFPIGSIAVIGGGPRAAVGRPARSGA